MDRHGAGGGPSPAGNGRGPRLCPLGALAGGLLLAGAALLAALRRGVRRPAQAAGDGTTDARTHQQLLEQERAARRDAETARERLALLGELTRLLGSSLDPDAVIERLVGLVVSRVAEGCTVMVPGEQGLRCQLSRRRNQPPLIPAALDGATEVQLQGTSPEAIAFRTGEPQLSTVVPAVDGPQGADGAAASVVLAVPLAAHGSVIGVMSFLARPGATFDADDVSLAAEIAARAGLALRNAQRYQHERGVAEALQRAVLPERLGEVEGLALDAEYRAGTSGTLAGGDWYDTVELEDGCLYFSVGDVMGKGPQAAALMGQVRSAMRAYAVDYPSPATVLASVDRLFEVLDERRLVSAVVGITDPATGETWLANAGHPPPLVVRRSGEVEVIDQGRSVILGAGVGRPERLEHRLQLAPGDSLLCYSDGLVERRGEPMGDGLDRLVGALGRLRFVDDLPQGAARGLVDTLLDGTDHRDDVAVLTIRYAGPANALAPAAAARASSHPWAAGSLPPAGNRVQLPASSASTTLARRWIAERLAELPRELVDTAALLTSELVTNAILHAGTGVVITVHRGPDRVRVDVADGSPVLPTVKGYGQEAAVGRGLTLFERLASDWGTRPIIPKGKIVWFELPVDIPGEWAEEGAIPFELEEWPAVLGHPAGTDLERSGTGSVTVRLLAVPSGLLRDCVAHYEALSRELRLILERDPDCGARLPGHLLALVDELADRYGTLGVGADGPLHDALARGLDRVDLELQMPPEIGGVSERSDHLFDEADEYCRSAELMTLAPRPELVAVRKWFFSELRRQVSGAPPTPWPDSPWSGAAAGGAAAGGAAPGGAAPSRTGVPERRVGPTG